MTVGFPLTKDQLDTQLGQIALQVRTGLTDAARLKALLDGQTDPQLTALGYIAAEITLMRAAYTDLYNLNRVATAQATQPAANDFFFNAKKLLGVYG